MKAIILAAGMGVRMDNTSEIPKCLLEINGKQIIRKQIESLNANNITDISVVVGYKEEMVKEACKDLKLKFYTNPNYKDTGMLESLFCAKNELNNNTIMIYGDVYFEKEVIKKLISDKNDFCLIVDKSKNIDHKDKKSFEEYHGEKIRKSSTKVFIEDNIIKKISKSLEKKETSAEYIGIAKFSEKGTKIIYENIKYLIDSGEIQKFPSPSYLINCLIEKGENINVVFVEENEYAEIDYEYDLDEAKKRFTKIKGIIFDAEDVIYSRDEETLKPILDFFKSKGFSVNISEFRDAYDKYKLNLYKGEISKDDHLKKTLDDLNIKYDNLFFDKFANVFRNTHSNIKINKDIKQIFENLKKKKVKIGILTDTFSSEQKKWDWFKKIELDKFIDSISCSSETKFTKDQKEAYEIALKKIGLTSNEVLFVGHNEYEMNGAKTARVKSVSIEKDVGEDIFIDDLKKILDLI